MARNFVTTELLGSNDLRDAPLQKLGPLLNPRSRVTFDVRQAVPILGDTSAYRNNLQRTAAERLSVGGSVLLQSAGSVVTHGSSRIDVSGGQLSYTGAQVQPSQLVGLDGTRYSLNTAPADIAYRALEASAAPVQNRWGTVTRTSSTAAGRFESGYVEGRAAGSFSVVAPRAVLDGNLAAHTTVGERQGLGLDALASAGRFQLGTPSQVGNFGSSDYLGAITNTLVRLAARREDLGDAFWNQGLDLAGLPSDSRVAADTLLQAGFGNLSISTDAGIVQEEGAALRLAPRATLSFNAMGAQGVRLGDLIASAGGSVSLRTADASAASRGGETISGAIGMEAGARIDVAGQWVNRNRDSQADPATLATGGGSVSLRAAHGLALQQGSAIDVSGGATVSARGTVSGGNAGTITLESNNALARPGLEPLPLELGARLSGFSMARGGSLRIRAPELDIRPGDAAPRTEGLALNLGDSFFSLGGFASFDLDGGSRLTVHTGALIAPRTQSWVADTAARLAPTGSTPGQVLATRTPPLVLRNAASLSLAATGARLDTPDGRLSLQTGSGVDLDPGATLNLRGAAALDMDGSLRAPGGATTLRMGGSFGAFSEDHLGSFRIGENARIDTSSVALVQPDGDRLLRGRVLDGGAITLSAVAGQTRITPLEVAAGAVLQADGAQAELNLAAEANLLRNVASQGGAITLQAREGQARRWPARCCRAPAAPVRPAAP